jgi:hypothetical protein
VLLLYRRIELMFRAGNFYIENFFFSLASSLYLFLLKSLFQYHISEYRRWPRTFKQIILSEAISTRK